jgi:hypothetical protein
MYYMFLATLETAQGHLQTYILQTTNNPFRSVNKILKALKTAFLNLN